MFGITYSLSDWGIWMGGLVGDGSGTGWSHMGRKKVWIQYHIQNCGVESYVKRLLVWKLEIVGKGKTVVGFWLRRDALGFGLGGREA